MQQDPNSLPALDGISPELAAGLGGAAFTVFLTFICVVVVIAFVYLRRDLFSNLQAILQTTRKFPAVSARACLSNASSVRQFGNAIHDFNLSHRWIQTIL